MNCIGFSFYEEADLDMLFFKNVHSLCSIMWEPFCSFYGDFYVSKASVCILEL